MTAKLNYLNVGCGTQYHKDWVNIDIKSNDPAIISYNLLKGIPFPDEEFEILYHSHVLEHIPKEKSFDFMKECHR
ncbi:methyltransferase type 11, partial [Candidatus Neomarinimicrobiota bacterium]